MSPPLSRINKELNISNLDLSVILHQRGKVVSSIRSEQDTFFGLLEKKYPQKKVDLYELFRDKKNREMIRGQILNESAIDLTPELIIPNDQGNMNYYSATFEWYVSEILKRDFGFLGSGFGIRIKNSPDGSDYDVLGMSYFDLVHIECKSGKPKNIDDSDITHFIERSQFINATLSIFYIDYKGIHKEFLFNIERFKYLSKDKKPEKIWCFRNKKICSQVLRTSHHPIYIVDSNTSEQNVTENLRSVLDIHHSIEAIKFTRLTTDFSKIEEKGYEVKEFENNGG